MNVKLLDRLKAFGVHFLLSVIVILAFFTVIYFVWFPNGLIYAGALEGLKVVVVVDLVLGPLLTFIVYNTAKKSLKWDLAVIVLIQLGALIYGGKIVFDERPVIAVMAADAVHLVTASSLSEWKIPETYRSYQGPRNYYLDVENDLAKIMPAEAVHEFTEGRPYAAQADLYKALGDIEYRLFSERAELMTSRQENNSVFQKVIKEHAVDKNTCTWLPLRSKHVFDFGFVCLNKDTGIQKTLIIPMTP